MKFSIPPDQADYSITEGASFISTELEGGLSRRRKDVINASDKADVQWTLDREDYNYFRAFFETATQSGSLPFELDMILDHYYLEEYTVAFVENSIKLDSVEGHTYTVSAQLEVQAKPIDHAANQLIIDEYNLDVGPFMFSASSVYVEENDNLVATGTFAAANTFTLTLSVTEEDDTLVSSTIQNLPLGINGLLSVTEENDTLSSTATFLEPPP